MGAADGMRNSNTYAFEISRFWKGLLIEASPTAFAQLQQRTERTRSLKLNLVVSDVERQLTYIDIVGSGDQLSCIKEFASQAHLNRIRSWVSGHNPKGMAAVTETPVTGRPLSDILAEHNMTHVNIFSLDVEGAEYSVLRTLDFAKVKFDVLVIEVSEGASRNDILNLLVSKGYKRFHQGQDDFYCRNEVCHNRM